jgi:4-amino-4-deoxy-L-arabinose transferase-like glycosyltransferase
MADMQTKTQTQATGTSKRARLIYLMLLGLYAFRFGLLGALELALDEAHYWYWSKHLALSYYDHPPMVAYIMALFTGVGGNTELFVRLGGFLCAVMATVLLFLTAKTLDPEDGDRPWEAIGVLNLSLLFAAGCLIQTPETPLLLFWTLALYSGAKLITARQAHWWYVFGCAVGLGLLSKYTMILIMPCMLGFLLLSPEHRYWLARKEPYLATGIAVLLFTPVLIWNGQHQWSSFTFQLQHGFTPDEEASIMKLLSYLGGQFVAMTPLLLCAFVYYGLWGLYVAVKEGNTAYLYLSAMSWPILVFFGVSTWRGETAEPNWTAPAYLAGGLLMWMVYRRFFSRQQGHRVFMGATLILALAINLAVYIHLLMPFLPIPPHQDQFKQFRGWREMAQTIEAYMAQYPSPTGYFLVANRGLTTVSEAIFYTGNRFLGIDFFRPHVQTFLQDEIDDLKGKDAIILINDFTEASVEHYRPFFKDVELIGKNEFDYRGHSVYRLNLHILRGQTFLGNWSPHIP